MNILGVRVDNLSKKEILEKIEFFLNEGGFHQIATVNPEFILEAQKNTEFRQILNRSSLNVADGIGLKYAFIWNGAWLKTRLAGADLMDEILRIANKKDLNVFLAINKNGLSSLEEIKTALLKKYPKLKVNGADIDPRNLSYKLKPKTYNLLFCNFGAPYQERFINSQKNDILGLAMGVGGSFDFLTGKTPRAPKWMRKIGLEWLFRLILEPRYRFGRIFRAVTIFPIKVILDGYYGKKQ